MRDFINFFEGHFLTHTGQSSKNIEKSSKSGSSIGAQKEWTFSKS